MNVKIENDGPVTIQLDSKPEKVCQNCLMFFSFNYKSPLVINLTESACEIAMSNF